MAIYASLVPRQSRPSATVLHLPEITSVLDPFD